MSNDLAVSIIAGVAGGCLVTLAQILTALKRVADALEKKEKP